MIGHTRFLYMITREVRLPVGHWWQAKQSMHYQLIVSRGHWSAHRQELGNIVRVLHLSRDKKRTR